MKIVQHCVYFPPEVGGLESHVFYLCRGLVDRGHDVTVVTSRSQPGLAAREVVDGIDVRRTWLPGRTPVGWGVHALASVPATRAALEGADVVHAQAFASILPCAVARRKTGAPLVATLHTSHFLRYAARWSARPLLRKLVEATDHNFAASKEIADVVRALGPSIRAEALANGVDTDFFRPGPPSLDRVPDRFRLVAPRRLFQKNGVEYLVRAMPLIARDVAVDLVLVGDGPERGRLEALSRELGVERAVTFLGARPHEDMPGLLASADLAVFPSLMEATSVGALEAMACELPVAASNVGGLPELVDESVGGLFPPGDPAALAEAVVALLRGGKLTEKGREARRRVIDNWSNDRLVERHLEVYARLVKEARGQEG